MSTVANIAVAGTGNLQLTDRQSVGFESHPGSPDFSKRIFASLSVNVPAVDTKLEYAENIGRSFIRVVSDGLPDVFPRCWT
jgi:hypothetical protein